MPAGLPSDDARASGTNRRFRPGPRPGVQSLRPSGGGQLRGRRAQRGRCTVPRERGGPLESFALGFDLFTQFAAYAIVYVLPEAACGRTLGKLCTGTKVVDLRGGKPSFGQVLARTAIRLVPFDAFSFLWGEPVGWHDSWSKTRVVLVNDPYADV
jgi:hypothetical protein